MSVSVTFEPSGISGLVAQGTYLIEAARRMGAPIGDGCTAGKGECPSCVIAVQSGANLLSPPTLVESNLFGAEGLNDSLRLACQTKIEGQGDIVLLVTTHRRESTTSPENLGSEIEQKFAALSLNQKIGALLKFEAITMSEALDVALKKPLAFGTRAFDSVVAKARAAKVDPKQQS